MENDIKKRISLLENIFCTKKGRVALQRQSTLLSLICAFGAYQNIPRVIAEYVHIAANPVKYSSKVIHYQIC